MKQGEPRAAQRRAQAPPTLYSVGEAAEYLGYTRGAIHMAIKRGSLAALRTQRMVTRYQIREEELERYRLRRLDQPDEMSTETPEEAAN